MIEQIKARIAEIETAIQNLVTNHTAWSAQLAEARHFLDIATNTAEAILPGNPVVVGLEAVDKVVDEASNVVAEVLPVADAAVVDAEVVPA